MDARLIFLVIDKFGTIGVSSDRINFIKFSYLVVHKYTNCSLAWIIFLLWQKQSAYIDIPVFCSIYVVSTAFEGQSAVNRQRMVYKAIWEELQSTVHAVDQMVTSTPAEANKTSTPAEANENQ